MNGRERVWKRPFGSGHSPYLLTHSTDNVENTFFAITVVKWSCVVWSEIWGPGFVSGLGRPASYQTPDLTVPQS